MTPDIRPDRANGPLIVIPCLNEARHIAGLLHQMEKAAARLGGLVVVVDGGSTDGTQEIAAGCARLSPLIRLMHNAQRIQSAAVNLAVGVHGQGRDCLIRIDAHCGYEDAYCDLLLEEARRMSADSVVVSMIARGNGAMQRINAAAQNAPIGNGGSRHRKVGDGAFVEHGHHALIRMEAFRAVGGYDPRFAHNEDAELDVRLRRAGYRIWLTARAQAVYYPRRSLSALARQYFNHGKGRAQNLRKHRMVPKLRQAKVMFVLPALGLALLCGLHWLLAVPALLWAGVCVLSGLRSAIAGRDVKLALIGLPAMVMHLSWSAGFWQKLISPPRREISR